RASITVPPRNTTKVVNQKAEFICEAKALPTNLTHRWFYNNIEISQLSWLETRTLVRRDGTLFINPTSAEDSGKYTCEVSNGIGEPETASAYLSVEYPARVVHSPSPQYLPLGNPGMVICDVKSNPPFQFVTWTKDSTPYQVDEHHGVISLKNGSLLIQRVSHVHQGMYRCTPYNIHGTAGTSSRMEVFVREPPMFTIKPNGIYQSLLGSEITIPCDGRGQPKPVIMWRRMWLDRNNMTIGVQIPPPCPEIHLFVDASLHGCGALLQGQEFQDIWTDYESTLHINIFKLLASLVDISGMPHAPTNVTVNTSASTATLSWLPAYDGRYPQSYIICYRVANEGANPWRTMSVPDGATTFTLYRLDPDTEYEFRVQSRNALGKGMYSAVIRAKTSTEDFLGNSSTPTTDNGAPPNGPVQKPLGPKPFSPEDIIVKKRADGVLILWKPPFDQTIPVAFYYVEYRVESEPWKRWGPIKDRTSYLAKKVPPGTYKFRVWAYSNKEIGSPSPEISLTIEGVSPEVTKSRAITAGVVGGILFLIAAIVLSVCAVKICNKRKRRKAEKAYMMVTCPVTDARNGGHSHGGSPSPLKKSPCHQRRTKASEEGCTIGRNDSIATTGGSSRFVCERIK
ncbi:protein turtle-like, partial [Limulus polyphemus]|uniref:Protein turtle-like n=1 Tax=Limulus polyphemus TaxID=6850 RepID=A0ABM1BPS0_LIMPO